MRNSLQQKIRCILRRLIFISTSFFTFWTIFVLFFFVLTENHQKPRFWTPISMPFEIMILLKIQNSVSKIVKWQRDVINIGWRQFYSTNRTWQEWIQNWQWPHRNWAHPFHENKNKNMTRNFSWNGLKYERGSC